MGLMERHSTSGECSNQHNILRAENKGLKTMSIHEYGKARGKAYGMLVCVCFFGCKGLQNKNGLCRPAEVVVVT